MNRTTPTGSQLRMLTDPCADLFHIPLDRIDPSPFQQRKAFAPAKLEELRRSIEREGLIQPAVVRVQGERFELIAGERRVRACRLASTLTTVLARVVEVDDLTARRMCAAENLQREDLSAVEAAGAVVEMVDAVLVEDEEYAAAGGDPAQRVKWLLGRLDSVRRSQDRESEVSAEAQRLSHKFVGQVERIFARLPRPVEWRSFYAHDLSLVTELDPEVRQWAIDNRLNKSQTTALDRLKKRAPETFDQLKWGVQADGQVNINPGALPLRVDVEEGEATLRDITADQLRQLTQGEIARNERERQRPIHPTIRRIPDGRFDLILADPPWRYDFSLDSADAIERHYPTLDLPDICAIPVADRAHSDCVLFLWATSPKLDAAFEVLRAWGFDYKTSAAWKKIGPIGMGYYFRQDHELLLVATRGAPGTPLPAARPSSVIEAPKGQHSKKPELVYELLERMYPNARRLELFARETRPNWTAWGNEVSA